MDQREKQELTEKLIKMARNSLEPSLTNRLRRPNMELGGDGFTFCLVENIFDLYQNVVKQLQQRSMWKQKFSKNYINAGMQRVLAKIVRDIRQGHGNSNAAQYIDFWVEELESYSQENTTLLPLAGIYMDIEELEIGKITLLMMSNTHAAEVAKNIETAHADIQLTNEQKERLIHSWLNKLRGKVCVKFNDIAEPERLRERTEEEISRVFDLFRYSIHMMGLDGYRIAVGLWGEVVRVDRDTPVISSDFRQTRLCKGCRR